MCLKNIAEVILDQIELNLNVNYYLLLYIFIVMFPVWLAICGPLVLFCVDKFVDNYKSQ